MIDNDLRPLGIGEILDRAVTLFVRRFAVLVLILAVVAIPLAIVAYITQPGTGQLLADFQRLLALPPGHTAEQQAILREISARNRFGALGVLLIAASAVGGALSSTACIIAVAQVYAGTLPSVREVYREALRRWMPQLIAVVVFAGIAFVATIVLAIVAFLLALAIAAIGYASKITAAIVGIPVGLIVAAVFVLTLVFVYFAGQMAAVSIALEEPNPIRGIAHGLRRTLSRAVFWRSALVGTALFAVSLVGSLVLVALGASLSQLTHWSPFNPIVTVVGGVALHALLIAFTVIYAIDVRVRREGYDLELAVRSAAHPTAP